MNVDVKWNNFEIKNPDTDSAFERMCTHLFCRKYEISGYDIQQNYNQAGLETDPIEHGGKRIGFQCKYCKNSRNFYKLLYDSLTKALDYYSKLNEIIVYTNLKIQPNCSDKELKKLNNNNYRVQIYNLINEKKITITYITETNFSEILSAHFDIYQFYFSNEEMFNYLKSNLSLEERTFLKSNDFFNIPINDKYFFDLENDFLENKINLLKGKAGTGKTKIVNRFYLTLEEKYLCMVKEKKKEELIIPIYLKMRDLNGNDMEINIQ